MNPQGSSTINLDWLDSIQDALNNITICSDIQALIDEIFATLDALMQAMYDQIDKLLAWLALIEIPTIEDIITWVTDFIMAFIEPQTGAYLKYLEQLEAYAAAIAALIDAIAAIELTIPDCSLTVSAPDFATPPGLPVFP